MNNKLIVGRSEGPPAVPDRQATEIDLKHIESPSKVTQQHRELAGRTQPSPHQLQGSQSPLTERPAEGAAAEDTGGPSRPSSWKVGQTGINFWPISSRADLHHEPVPLRAPLSPPPPTPHPHHNKLQFKTSGQSTLMSAQQAQLD